MKKKYIDILHFIMNWFKFILTVPAALNFLREMRTSAGLFFINYKNHDLPGEYFEQ